MKLKHGHDQWYKITVSCKQRNLAARVIPAWVAPRFQSSQDRDHVLSRSKILFFLTRSLDLHFTSSEMCNPYLSTKKNLNL